MSTRRAVAITSLGNIVAPAAGLITAPMLALALGVTGRGELAAATAPLLLASNAVTLGLPSAITFYTSKRTPREGRLIAVSFIFLGLAGLVATGIIALLSPALAAGDRELAGLIVLSGLGVTPALILAGCRALALGRQFWWLVAVEKFVASVLRVVLIVTLWLVGSLDLLWATVVIAGTTFAGLVVYLLLPFMRVDGRPQVSPGPSTSELLSYGLRVWLGSLSGILLIRLGQTLMVPLAGAYELGLFAVAVTISEAALVFNAAVATVVFSQESRSSDGSRLADTTRVSTLVTLVMAVGIGLASLWAVPFFFGEDFVPALPSLWVLLLAIVLGNPGSVAGQGLNARKRPGLRSASLAIALGFNLIATIALVPTLGSFGAALAQLVANVVAGALNLYWLRRKFGLHVKDFVLIRGADVRTLGGVLRRRRRD